MGLEWFKLHHTILDDPDILKLSPETFREWIRMLAIACRRNGDLGDLDDPGDIEKLALLLRFHASDGYDVERAAGVVRSLRDSRLIERADGRDRPRNWDKFQGETDAAARMRKFRARQRSGVADSVTQRNGYEQCEHVRTVTKTRQEENRQEVDGHERRSGLAVAGTKPPERDLMAEFQAWIGRYPRQENTDAACRQWISLVAVGEITAENVADVLAGLERWIDSRSWEDEGGRFVPRPDRWLRDRLWLDHPPKGEGAKARENFPEWEPPKKRREPESEAA